MSQVVTEIDRKVSPATQKQVRELRELALQALRRMYRPEHGVFAFRLGHEAGTDRLTGVSHRYTAIALLGMLHESAELVGEILDGDTPEAVCGRLIDAAATTDDIGEAALTLWAARRWQHPRAELALAALRRHNLEATPCPTVEYAWCLSALACESPVAQDAPLARTVADRLLATCVPGTGIFSHLAAGSPTSWLRGHVSCYADFVYPIQALALFHRCTGDDAALAVARRCADKMCSLQGPEGQWWWHFDVRTAQVVERYPVYAIHQDAMGPMCLFELQAAGGGSYLSAVERCMKWLGAAPEIASSLIDRDAAVVWRKVARREPNKLARGLQAGASRLLRGLRVPALDTLLPPRKIDFETRPYHMGWLLYAWSL